MVVVVVGGGWWVVDDCLFVACKSYNVQCKESESEIFRGFRFSGFRFSAAFAFVISPCTRRRGGVRRRAPSQPTTGINYKDSWPKP